MSEPLDAPNLGTSVRTDVQTISSKQRACVEGAVFISPKTVHVLGQTVTSARLSSPIHRVPSFALTGPGTEEPWALPPGTGSVLTHQGGQERMTATSPFSIPRETSAGDRKHHLIQKVFQASCNAPAESRVHLRSPARAWRLESGDLASDPTVSTQRACDAAKQDLNGGAGPLR